jgi:hypothetical protein
MKYDFRAKFFHYCILFIRIHVSGQHRTWKCNKLIPFDTISTKLEQNVIYYVNARQKKRMIIIMAENWKPHILCWHILGSLLELNRLTTGTATLFESNRFSFPVHPLLRARTRYTLCRQPYERKPPCEFELSTGVRISGFLKFALCPSFDILKNITFRKLDLFPSSGERVGRTSFVRSI